MKTLRWSQHGEGMRAGLCNFMIVTTTMFHFIGWPFCFVSLVVQQSYDMQSYDIFAWLRLDCKKVTLVLFVIASLLFIVDV